MYHDGMLDFGAVRLEFGTMIFQAVIFLILLFIVRKFALGPAMGVMEERQNHIRNEISVAEDSRKEAEAFLKEQRTALEEARNEAYEIIERAKKQSELEGADIIKSAQERAQRTLEEARAEISREKDQAVEALHNEVATLSVQIASKVLTKELDEKSQKKLVDDYLQEVGGAR
jgi:F-type H+-transporting ATPase subunit b